MDFNQTAKFIPHVENEIGLHLFSISRRAFIYLKRSSFNQTTNKIVFHSGGTSAPVVIHRVRMGLPLRPCFHSFSVEEMSHFHENDCVFETPGNSMNSMELGVFPGP